MEDKNDTIFLRYYCACVIDVLGQKRLLANWSNLPDNGVLTQEYLQAIKKTVGTVLGFKDHFLSFLDQFDRGPRPQRFAALPKDKIALYDRAKSCIVHVQRLSDTFVFSSPIQNDHGDISVFPVYRILAACIMAMRVSLAAKVPLRGAISIGTGVELEDGGFYGPALAEADSIERRVASYPRIVVAESVCKFLQSGRAYSPHPLIAQIMEQMSALCRDMICRDDDQEWIVDFLGARAREVLGSDEGFPPTVKPGYEFVKSEAERFRMAGDAKLAERYNCLLKYFKARISCWGLGE
jgi:hypothetical protein